jgi:hypothetical protein
LDESTGRKAEATSLIGNQWRHWKEIDELIL